jgi:hypothetical protein
VIAILVALLFFVPVNLYQADAVRLQMPDSTACTAASVQTALNIELHTSDTSYATQEKILAYERQHQASSREVAGSDPVGVRNALDHFGRPAYSIFSGTFDQAIGRIRESIRKGYAVVIFGEGGFHAILITGYGPNGVFMVDPMGGTGSHAPDAFVDLDYFARYYFTPFTSPGSFLRDPVTGLIGNKAWHGKWVEVAA